MDFSTEQIQQLVFGFSRQMAALYGRAITEAGLEISALADDDPDAEVARVINQAYLKASQQSLDLVRIFGRLPGLADNPDWATVQQSLEARFELVINRVIDADKPDLEKLETVLEQLSQVTEIPLPGVAGAANKTLGEVVGGAQFIVDATNFVSQIRTGDFSGALTSLVMIPVGWVIKSMVEPALALLGLSGWPLAMIGSYASGVIEDAAEEDISAFFQKQLANEEAAFVVERYYRLYGQGFQSFDGIKDVVAMIGGDGDDYQSGLSENENVIATGAGNDIVYGAEKTDAIAGGGDNDTLYGLAGDDEIDGGDGNDILVGGAGSDTLTGGAGFDSYQFELSDFSKDSEDVVIDADGVGKITFDGIAIGDLSVNPVSRDERGWETHDRAFRIQVVGTGTEQSLVISHRATGGRIWVKNWQNGDLSITLPGLGLPQTPENPIVLTNADDVYGFEGYNFEPPSANEFYSALGGNDGIDGGYGDDWIDGGPDNDLVLGGPGSNRLLGGSGNDVILGLPVVMAWGWQITDEIADAFPNLIDKGKTWFTETGGYAPTPGDAPANFFNFTVMARAIWQSGASWDSWMPATQRNGADDIDGGDGSDVAYGGEGNDTVHGGIGNDVLTGGADHDYLSGDEGDDLMFGDDIASAGGIWAAGAALNSDTSIKSGNDVMSGGLGNDRIYGEGGNDIIDGGDGDDILQGDLVSYGLNYSLAVDGDAGNDRINGGAGNDQIFGDQGNDSLLGDEGDDLVFGGEGNDIIEGGAGVDQLVGEAGDDRISGGDGNDLLFGDAGRDVLAGDAGNDQLSGGDDDDRLDGGAGDDLLIGGAGNDAVIGGTGNDELQGGSGDDALLGGAGVDNLFGEAGNDRLDGGADNDALSGGDGDDQLFGGGGDDAAMGGAGADHLDGGTGNDRLWGQAGNDSLYGGDGDDYLDGDEMTLDASQHGRDYLEGGAGADIIHGEGNDDEVHGGDGDDYLYGDDYERTRIGNDKVYGDAGNDLVDGGAGDDELYGGEGNDRLVGGNGNDLLDGGRGDDQLHGGAGNDRYVFGLGSGKDVVEGLADADAGVDTLVLGAGIAPTDVQVSVGAEGALILTLPGGTDSLTLKGYFSAEAEPLSIQFASGTTWTRQQMLARTGAATGGTYSGSDFVSGAEPYTVSNDTLIGSAYSDYLYGKAGADVLYGQDGNDYLYGDDADVWPQFDNSDRLYGGNGSDTLYGRIGNDLLDGGAGGDYLYGGDGNDTLIGGAGNDLLSGGAGMNTYRFKTGFGNDSLSLAAVGTEVATILLEDATPAQATIVRASGTLSIRVGTDVINISQYDVQPGAVFIQFKNGVVWDRYAISALLNVGTEGNDTLYGTDRADVLDGKGGNDALYGAQGNDQLLGGAGNDYLYGEAGADVLDGGAGNDQLQGGDGVDTYVLSIGQGADRVSDTTSTVRLGPGVTAANLVATLIDYGYSQQLVLGIAGTNDSLTFDLSLGSAGDAGVALPFDRIEFADGTTWGEGEVRALLAAVVLLGTGQADILVGDGQANKAYGFGGDDTISVLGGDDRVFAGGGDDIVDGGEGGDYLYGELGNDVAIGAGGDDYVYGDGGNDHVSGGAGRDYVFGDSFFGNGSTQNDGNDILEGGTGNDELDGGLGDDVFLFNLGDGDDVIVDGATAYNPYNNQQDPGFDVIRFGQGIRLEDLDFSIAYRDAYGGQDGDLVVSNRVSGDRVTVKYVLRSVGYSGGGGPLSTIDRIEFADGTSIAYADLMARAGYRGNMIIGTTGNDNLQGTQGVDILDGKGDNGQDTLSGGGGSDTYQFGRGSGRDYIYDSYYTYFPATGTWGYTPEDGVDIVQFDIGIAPSDLYVDPYYRGIGVSGSDVFLCRWDGIEEFHFADGTVWNQSAIAQFLITPTEGNNLIQGTSGNDVIEGLGGDDTLYGNAGNDTLHGGTGSDRLYGNAGDDVLKYQLGDGLDSLGGDEGFDVLEFGPGIEVADLMAGRYFGSLHLALAGTDDGVVIDGAYAYDYTDPTLNNAPFELIRFADGTELTLADLAPNMSTGNDASQEIIGTANGDLIDGLRGDDRIRGFGGDDTLLGGAGNDTLEGGTGNDLLRGGDGDDSYTFKAGDGQDLIDNREVNGGYDSASLAYGSDALSVNRNSNDLVVSFNGSADSVTFQHWFEDPSARVESIYANGDYFSADALEALIPPATASRVEAAATLAFADIPDVSQQGTKATVPEARGIVQAIVRPAASTQQLQNLVDTMAAFSSQAAVSAADSPWRSDEESYLHRDWRTSHRNDTLAFSRLVK